MAFQQADYVAWNLWASINRRPLLPFKYQHLGEMMSLGRARGAVTLPLPLAPPLRQALNGGLVGSLLSLGGIKCAPYPHPRCCSSSLFITLAFHAAVLKISLGVLMCREGIKWGKCQLCFWNESLYLLKADLCILGCVLGMLGDWISHACIDVF